MATSTVKSWKQGGAPIDDALSLMLLDGLTTAMHLRRRVLGKAMAVKTEGLDAGDARLRQSVASEIIEWELGRATQRQEVEQDGQLTITVKREASGGKDYTPTDTAPGAEADSE